MTPSAAVRCAAFGDRALLVEPGLAAPDPPSATAWVLAVADAARRQWPQASVVPGLRSVLVSFEPGQRPEDRSAASDALVRQLGAGAPSSRDEGTGPPLRIDVRYDGPDLSEVAGLLGVGTDALVSRHQSAVWTVAAIGFSSGFAYLTTADPLFASVPRRGEPRTRVPAGSLALAAGMCAVYPSATPGGWQLIGASDHVLFDVDADPPALLRPGDRIEFRAES